MVSFSYDFISNTDFSKTPNLIGAGWAFIDKQENKNSDKKNKLKISAKLKIEEAKSKAKQKHTQIMDHFSFRNFAFRKERTLFYCETKINFG